MYKHMKQINQNVWQYIYIFFYTKFSQNIPVTVPDRTDCHLGLFEQTFTQI